MYRFLVGHFSSTPFQLVCANRRSLGSSPAAYPSLSSNALDDLQSDLTILLESVLPHPSLRPTNLVIVPGKKAWAAKLDAVVFADGGNIVDCLMLACRAALWDTKVPRTKRVEYRAPRRHPTQGDVGMDVDVDKEAEERGGLETKGVSTATDFELTDYWDEGEVLNGRESWPVCVTLNVVRLFFRLGFVPS
jgi:exosome complex component RRP42